MTTNLRDFLGNPNAFAEQQADGTYRPVRSPLNDADLAAHALGQKTVGTYVVWLDKARMFVFDVDDRDLRLANVLAEACRARGFTPGVEFSGRKGYHVWVLLDQWASAADMQRVAKSIAAEVGFNGEVFPKQAAARDLGSLVKLPLGVHAVTGNQSRFLSEPEVSPVAVFLDALAALPPEPAQATTSGSGPLPCVDSIQSDPPKEGTRNNLYFHFACHLRRMGLHEEAITAVLEDLWKNPAPGELEGVVANSEFSGPMCDSVPADRHCGEACIKNRAKGLSLRPGQLKNGTDGELVVVRRAGHTEGLDNVVNLEHPDLRVARAVLKEGS
jgi:hypothetical protein